MSQDEIITALQQCVHWGCMSEKNRKEAINYYRNVLELEERKISEKLMRKAA